uniref:Uncharacterized protein n=1 Tax=Utricularia reniformis TaxID=192314 RepID=A0A1Y0B4E4_9LAMI|nr:hypothetical protein AEK19_MT2104 [Utricularia reniformis]ART32257.1 hypothetical protein AEK19_MT2104 [Utricularia reniformis]
MLKLPTLYIIHRYTSDREGPNGKRTTLALAKSKGKGSRQSIGRLRNSLVFGIDNTFLKSRAVRC